MALTVGDIVNGDIAKKHETDRQDAKRPGQEAGLRRLSGAVNAFDDDEHG